MADTDKNILITPNVGSTDEPTIVFTGSDNNPVTLRVLDDGTISFEGSSGQLFSVADNLAGTIFSVNDISGIPSIEVDDTGVIRLAEFTGNVLLGTDVDDGSSKLQVAGNIAVSGTVDGRDIATDGSKLDGIASNANNYTHPTHPGDDFSVDTGALTGATVVSDIDINVTTDTLGHVTDANGSVVTRTLTLGDLGFTGATNANYYTLPEATSTVRGGIELFSDTDQTVAANAVSSTAGRTYGIQLNSAGQAVVNVPWVNTTYGAATSTTYGLVKPYSDTDQTVAPNAVTSTSGRTYAVQLDSSGRMMVNVPWVDTDTNTTYSAASTTNLGLIKLEDNTVQTVAANAVTATASRTYGVQVNSSGQAVVNVPWVDTNTVYSHPTHPGDDIDLDTGALTGATVISGLDFNVTTDTLGHVTDANATYSTRNLTYSDVGALSTSGGTVSGTVTANAFVGDGSGITNLPSVEEVVTSNKFFSSIASLVFTNLDLTTYDYTFVYRNFIPATNGALIVAQFSTDNGASWITSGYSYAVGVITTAGSYGDLGDNGTSTYIRTQFSGTNSWSSYNGSSGEMQLTNNWSSQKPTLFYKDYTHRTDGYKGFQWGAGRQETSITMNALKISYSSGNIANGGYTLYRKKRS